MKAKSKIDFHRTEMYVFFVFFQKEMRKKNLDLKRYKRWKGVDVLICYIEFGFRMHDAVEEVVQAGGHQPKRKGKKLIKEKQKKEPVSARKHIEL